MRGGPEWELDGGVPVLCGNVGTLECRPWNVYDGGDHIIVIGEVVSLEYDLAAEPLVFYGGKFRTMGELIDGAPWNLSGDGPESGWFAGSRVFKALYSG
jgi:flavin reductase (DIM6/NTAB) family NADH-FMN oxidoreductase RutF